MTIEIKLKNYDKLEVDGKREEIVVRDCACESDFVFIKIGDQMAKVAAEEMIQAIKRCRNAQWPY